MARNYQIIMALQEQVEGRLAVRPGVYDGRKNLLTSFNLEFESGSHEAIFCHIIVYLRAQYFSLFSST